MLSAAPRWAFWVSLSVHLAGLLLIKFSVSPPQQRADAPLMIQLQLEELKVSPQRPPQPPSERVENRVVTKSIQMPRTLSASTRTSEEAKPAASGAAVSETTSHKDVVIQPLDLSTAKAIAIPPERQSLVQRKSHPNLAPQTKEVETELAKQLSKAVLPDCRQAYSGAGLLALPMLMRDAVTESGCTW